MPEGDAIYRTAATLNRALGGKEIVRFDSVLPALTRVHDDQPITGRTVERVTATGKHLLVRFSGDLVLRTHMRMNGSWHIYRVGERWRRPRRDMRIVIATRDFEAVAFNVPVAEFLDRRHLERQDDLRQMGPDLLGPSFDMLEALRRFRDRPADSIADAFINQRVVAGAGNVYKSEVLFLTGINPFRQVSSIPDDQLAQILNTARKYLKVNVTHPKGGIVTYRGYSDRASGLHVYGRAGRRCRRCGTPINVAAQGLNARLTYWCPSCQKA
jgi:endonuclease-8